MNAFDNSEFEKYKDEVKEKWGKTEAYSEYSEKSKSHTEERFGALADGMNEILAEFAVKMKSSHTPDSAETQSIVKKLQNNITENYYTCTKEILSGLGQMYVYDERFKNNIDKHAEGTAEYISDAIKIYCK